MIMGATHAFPISRFHFFSVYSSLRLFGHGFTHESIILIFLFSSRKFMGALPEPPKNNVFSILPFHPKLFSHDSNISIRYYEDKGKGNNRLWSINTKNKKQKQKKREKGKHIKNLNENEKWSLKKRRAPIPSWDSYDKSLGFPVMQPNKIKNQKKFWSRKKNKSSLFMYNRDGTCFHTCFPVSKSSFFFLLLLSLTVVIGKKRV